MRYIAYIALLYLFLPLNHLLDLVTVMLFFIIFNENDWFAILFSFFAGLLIDLYNPTFLGLNALTYTILAQVLLYVKRFVARDLITVLLAFAVFFLLKVILVTVVTGSKITPAPLILTVAACVPLYLTANKLVFRTWLRH
ncbi:MAG TPA: rod shape-determining protein MreD [bacterium]